MERVVVTGVGLVTPNGIGTEPTWEALIRGESGVGPITAFAVNRDYATRIAAEVKGFDPARFMEKKQLKGVSRFIPFSVAATQLALDQAKLELSDEERDTTGVYIGVGLGGLETVERSTGALLEKGPSRVSPYFIPSMIPNMAAAYVSLTFGLRGASFAITSACASSAHAIGEAVRAIRHGVGDVMIAGGAEATITPVGMSGFTNMFALSRRNDDPQRASRPWDKHRDGFVCGEGAGTLVLESLTRARRRGARILAEIVGYGASSDSYHITKPGPGGEGGARAMRLALKDAALLPEQIDYLNAHGTSTPAGDAEETRAIATVFGAHAREKKLWVSSTKSMMGHLLGAAGAVEAGVCIKAVQTGIVPPTINLDDPDPEAMLDYVPHTARERRVRYAMSNSFGFGGTNATVIVAAFSN